MTPEQFDEEIQRAAQGDWEALGLDPPDHHVVPGFKPAKVEDLLNATE